MYDWRIVHMAQEQRHDLLREAEHERLAKLAVQGRRSRGNAYSRTLLRLGLRIVSLAARPHLHGGGAPNRPGLSSAR